MVANNGLTPEEIGRGVAAIEQVTATVARTADAVLPIWGVKDNGVPFVTGSGFLLRIRDAVFLITAAHTLAIHPRSALYVSANKRHVGLNAVFSRTKANDAIDLAFARLDGRMEDLVESYRVLTLDEVDVLDWPERDRMYSFIGYPHSLNKVNLRDKTFEPTIQPYTSHKPLLLDDYARLALNPCAVIAVFFDLSEAEVRGSGDVVRPKMPTGISGGPVWRLGSFAEFHLRTNREKVVGLCTSTRRNPDVMLGARIGVVIEGIREQFPELSPELPTNPRCHAIVTLD